MFVIGVHVFKRFNLKKFDGIQTRIDESESTVSFRNGEG